MTTPSSCLQSSHQSVSKLSTSSRLKNGLSASYSSYVVRVHTRHGIKTLSFDILAAFFTFTAKKAAEDLGISSRTLIRVCRSLGIRRWPYLGFRSEKNVERIRQEAMENLRRKLEKDGVASMTSVFYPNASCLRGASAKRLLQVKLPHASKIIAFPKLAPSHVSVTEMSAWNSNNIHEYEMGSFHDADMDGIDEDKMEIPSQPMEAEPKPIARKGFQSPMMPVLTPLPTPTGFDLTLPSISPRKRMSIDPSACGHVRVDASRLFSAQLLPQRAISPQSTPKIPPVAQTVSMMPSINLLVDASILTAFKNDTESHVAKISQKENRQSPSYPRTMSMSDILSHTALAA